MSAALNLVATPWNESEGICTCCGNKSKTIWGDISVDETAVAVYFVQWTVASTEHFPNFDFVIGRWGEGASATDRILVSLLFRPGHDGGSFKVIDGGERLPKYSKVCARAMQRSEVIGTPLAGEVFALIDALWLTDTRMREVRELNQEV
jgi:predicted outer membrane lipoprotein